MVAVTACDTAPPENASDTFLRRAWDAYKQIYIQPAGNVIDPSRGNGETTSEGQGYAMLRAAWMHDGATFERVYQWTERHLARGDGLFSWRWTPANGGRVVDANTASDADQEIAFALVIASHVFQEGRYLERARDLVRAVRQHESVTLEHGWFPAAGNWAVSERIVNLSYFIPYAYPHFARIDPQGRWETAADVGYDLIVSIAREAPGRLVPDFMAVAPDGTPVPVPRNTGLSRDFSSDAMRIYWRVAVDCQLHGRPRACADPLGVRRLTAIIARDGVLYTRYTVDGVPLEHIESFSFYGAALPFFKIHAPATARAIQERRLSASDLDGVIRSRDRYFDANWVWFGLAAANDFIKTATPRPDDLVIGRSREKASQRP